MNTQFQRLCAVNTLFEAWKVVKSKNSAGGIDGFSVAMFDENLKVYLSQLQEDLRNGSWNPNPYLRVEIPKDENEKRKLGLLSVKDKIVQQAIKMLVEPIFERMFLVNSYGYRPDKGHYKAIKRSSHEMQLRKNAWIAQLDIDNYFDTINHDLLFSRLKSVIKDAEILRLIELSVKMGVVSQKMKWNDVKAGVPQGAVLSPILANFYLHPFDQFVTSKTKSYIRYADDFIIIADTKELASDLVKRSTDFLEKRLRLKLNEPFIGEVKNGIEFLGVVVKHHGISVSPEKEKKLHDRIQSLEIHNGTFSSKSLDGLLGIDRYYSRLLPQNYLKTLDEALIQKVNSLIEQAHYAISGRKVFSAMLWKLPFFSSENQLNRKTHINAWLEYYSEVKRRADVSGKEDDKKKNQKLIRQKKAEYQRRESENSELIVSSYGSFIGKNNRGISVKLKGKSVFEKTTSALEHITVTTSGVSISNNAIFYCMERKIPIDFFDMSGRLYASVLSPVFIDQSVWHQQATMPLERKALLASSIIQGKLRNQLNLMKYFHKYHAREGNVVVDSCEKAMELIQECIEKVKQSDLQNPDYAEVLRSHESVAAVAYWSYVRELLHDDDVEFEARVRKGATDLMNSLLNYGYAILYARIWQAVLAAKLNPSVAVFHAYQPGKPTFVYDLVEIFRSQAVDRIVIGLIQKKEPLKLEKGLLDEDTKRRLIQNILERLNRYEKFRGEEMKFSKIIKLQAKEVAEFIMDRKASFKPYLAKW
ncbi:MAG: CRISPR-associated endonuclease Cas1 [Tannerella sp.]|jgi:group II intron reverse transcriptase/maturase/CRISPR-associated endonuclease Cas1|nr:CRISPR-associated endonuclease Cas1 [Tannerella sp.]